MPWSGPAIGHILIGHPRQLACVCRINVPSMYIVQYFTICVGEGGANINTKFRCDKY